MRALIIGAGQGKRLLPLTETEPKALLNIGGKSLLAWQVDALADCGIRETVIVAGFNFPAVVRTLRTLSERRPGCRLRAVYNPFYGVADNLATCWMARSEMTGDFVLLNGDTLFDVPVLETLLATPAAPITLAIDQKAHYDADDMKVELAGTRLRDIGKTLPSERVHGESIGMLLFRGDGPHRFVQALDAAMLEPAGVKQFYLSAIAALARRIEVETVSVAGGDWCEIDYPLDLKKAQEMAAGWMAARYEPLSSVGTR